MRLDCKIYHGLASLITLTDGEYFYWDFPKAGKAAVCGKGMVWLQLIPDDSKRLVTAMVLSRKKLLGDKLYPYSVSVIYADVAEKFEYDPDGVAAYVDKYLDVVLTPQGDVSIDDRDELDEAFKSGELSEEQYNEALTECGSIIAQLGNDSEKTEKWCPDILSAVYERISHGAKPIENRIRQNENTGKE